MFRQKQEATPEAGGGFSMKSTALILINGSIGDCAVLRRRLRALVQPFVIAADGGYRHAEPLGLKVDLLIGDLDSTDEAAQRRLAAQGAVIEKFPPEKDETDLELALLAALERQAGRVVLLGALGDRIDMTLANLLLLADRRLSSQRVEAWYEWQTAWYMAPPGGRIEGRPGDTVSLIPVGGDAAGITTEGLAYALVDETLTAGRSRGISNQMTASTAQIEFSTGGLIVVHTADGVGRPGPEKP